MFLVDDKAEGEVEQAAGEEGRIFHHSGEPERDDRVLWKQHAVREPCIQELSIVRPGIGIYRVDDDGSTERPRHGLGDASAGAKLHSLQVRQPLDGAPCVEQLPGAVGEHGEQVNAFVFPGVVKITPVQAVIGDGGDFGGLPCAGKLGDQRQQQAARRVARRYE